MDPLTVAVSAASVVKVALQVVDGLWDVWNYYQSIKQVDQAIHNLHSSMQQVKNICSLVERHIKSLPHSRSASQENEDLLTEIGSQLSTCAAATHKINSKIKPVRQGKTNFIHQAIRQVRLDMSEDEINESRDQIEASIRNLQLILQLVILQATFIGPEIANRTLLEKIDEIQKMLAAQSVDKELKDCADMYLTRGTTLYAKSVGSSVGDFQAQSRPVAIAEWLENMRAVEPDESSSSVKAPGDDGLLAPSVSQETEETFPTSLQDSRSPNLRPINIADEDEDEFAMEMVQTTLTGGRKFYDEGNYKEAEVRLGECLAIMRTLPEHHRREYDFVEIHLLLSMCAFHLHDLTTAEAALLSALEKNAGTEAHAKLQCEVGMALAVVCVRFKKYDAAIFNCNNALKGRRRLFRKEHKLCYESIALLAYIYELNGHKVRADTYRSMIPDDQRKALESMWIQVTTHETSKNNESSSVNLDNFVIRLHSGTAVVAISASGGVLAYSLPPEGVDAKIMLYNLQHGSILRDLHVKNETAATCLAFNSDGKKLATGHGGLWRKKLVSVVCRPLSIRIWNVASGQILHLYTDGWELSDNLIMTSLVFTPKDDQLITTYTGHSLPTRGKVNLPSGFNVRDCTSGLVLHQVDVNGYTWLDFSMDGAYVAFTNGSSVHIYSIGGYMNTPYVLGQGFSCFDQDNNMVKLAKNDTIQVYQRVKKRTEYCIGIPKPLNQQHIQIDSGNLAVTTDNELIVTYMTAKRDNLYLVAPKLGLWRAIPASLFSKSTFSFSKRAEHLMCTELVRGEYYLKVLNVQVQLKLAQKLAPPKELGSNAAPAKEGSSNVLQEKILFR